MRVLQLGKFYDPFVGGIETVLKEICESLIDRVDFRVLVANTRLRTEHENRESPSLAWPAWESFFPARWRHRIRFGRESSMRISYMFIYPIPWPSYRHSWLIGTFRWWPSSTATWCGNAICASYMDHSSTLSTAVRIASSCPHRGTSKFRNFVSKYRNKCRVVPFGVPLSRFELDDGGRRKVDELRDGMPSVLCVGRLVSYKGVEFLIRAMEGY